VPFWKHIELGVPVIKLLAFLAISYLYLFASYPTSSGLTQEQCSLQYPFLTLSQQAECNLAANTTTNYTTTITLAKGWNLKGYDKKITAIDDIFDQSCISHIFTFNDGIWQKYKPFYPKSSTLSYIDAYSGSWIYAIENCSLTLFGTNSTDPTSDTKVTIGWNLKGTSSAINAVSSVFNDSCIEKVFIFRDGNWLYYTPNGYSTFTQLNENEGFWVNASKECNLALVNLNSTEQTPAITLPTSNICKTKFDEYRNKKALNVNPQTTYTEYNSYKDYFNSYNSDADCQAGLAFMNYAGDITGSENYASAYEWANKSTKGGSARGYFILGLLYERGNGVAKNYDKALTYYKIAANDNYAVAQKNVGRIYFYGNGVTKNYITAKSWFDQAAAQNEPVAQDYLGMIYYYGYGVSTNYTTAKKWYEKSANQGLASAQNSMGLFYLSGDGVSINYATAYNWFSKAASQEERYALNNIGYMYENGYYFSQNYTLAMNWYKKSADLGLGLAMANIGDLYYSGYGVTKSLENAKIWYQKAVDAGYTNAQERVDSITQELSMYVNCSAVVHNLCVIDSIGNSLDDFTIQGIFKNVKNFYKQPATLLYYDEGSSSNMNAMATEDNYMLFGKYLYNFIKSNTSHTANIVSAIIAHEFGHIVQFETSVNTNLINSYYTRQLVVSNNTVVLAELEADALGAMYMYFYLQNQMNALEYLEFVYNTGDWDFTDVNHHGTPTQRLQAAATGIYVTDYIVQNNLENYIDWQEMRYIFLAFIANEILNVNNFINYNRDFGPKEYPFGLNHDIIPKIKSIRAKNITLK
jgi:TPR repeat protein